METMELISMARKGDKEARDKVIQDNMGLVYSIVGRYAGRGYDSEELTQIGAIGLIKAVDKFDTGYDVKFSTYAVPLISGEIKRFLRDDGMVRVSRSIKENGWKIRRAADKLSQQLEREPSIEELAAATEIAPEDIVIALEANSEVESINRPICFSDGKEVSLEERIQEKTDWNEQLLNRMLVEQLMRLLDETEQALIRMRYYEDKTQREVAEQLGISQVQVSRLEKKILLNLRKAIDKNNGL